MTYPLIGLLFADILAGNNRHIRQKEYAAIDILHSRAQHASVQIWKSTTDARSIWKSQILR